MDNENKENLDALNQDGGSNEAEKFVPLTEEELEEMEVVEKDAYLKANSYALNQKKRAEKAEALLKEMKGSKPQEEKKPEPVKGDDFTRIAKISSMMKNLEEDEIERLTLEAQELGVSPEKYISSNSWKASLTQFRNEKKEENKTPTPSSRVAVYKGKSFGEVVKDDKASKEDKQKAFEATMKSRG